MIIIIIVAVAASAIILFYLKWLTQCSTFALSALIFISKVTIFFFVLFCKMKGCVLIFLFGSSLLLLFFLCVAHNVQNASNTSSNLHIALLQTAIGSFREFSHANQVHSLFEISDTSTKWAISKDSSFTSLPLYRRIASNMFHFKSIWIY